MIKYIKYFIDILHFNLHYISFYGAEINPFDNCSYKAYKRHLKREEINNNGNSK
jgi:hypothetical protein